MGIGSGTLRTPHRSATRTSIVREAVDRRFRRIPAIGGPLSRGQAAVDARTGLASGIADRAFPGIDDPVRLLTPVRASGRGACVNHRRSGAVRSGVMAASSVRSPARRARVQIAIGVVTAALAVVAAVLSSNVAQPTPPSGGDPPVVAGRQLWGSCAAGFYARRGDEVALTSSAHCADEGTTAYAPDGRTVRGVFGPAAVLDPCPHASHTCRPSDMNYLVVAPDQVPWGRLNVIDLGDGGQRVLEPGTVALACADIAIGDAVEINGRDRYRSGSVAEIGEYLHDPAADGDYFPCMVAATDIEVGVGDSGGAVLVRGLPAGVTSRSFGGILGFTPLAEGLDALGLDLCTTPDCGLQRP